MPFLPQWQRVFPDGSSSEVTMEVTLQSSPKENVRTVTASTCAACGDADLLLGTPADWSERDHKMGLFPQLSRGHWKRSVSPLSAAHRSVDVHQQQEKQRRSVPPRWRNVQPLQHDPDGEAADFSSAADIKQQQTSGVLSCIWPSEFRLLAGKPSELCGWGDIGETRSKQLGRKTSLHRQQHWPLRWLHR